MADIVKIKDSNITDLQAVISYIIVLVGIDPKKITPPEMGVIMDFIQRNFQHIGVEELKNAFELGVKGDLDIDLKHYQSFNTLYISNVIQAHKRYKAKQNRIKTLKPVEALPEPKKTKEQNAEDWYNWVKKEVDKSGKVPLMADWLAVYWYLEQNNLITISDDEKRKFAQKVKDEIEYDVKVRKAEHRDYHLIQSILEDKKSFRNECRKQFVIKYFEHG